MKLDSDLRELIRFVVKRLQPVKLHVGTSTLNMVDNRQNFTRPSCTKEYKIFLVLFTRQARCTVPLNPALLISNVHKSITFTFQMYLTRNN